MSSTRRTAFARTPRGNPGGAAAPAAITINKQFLDRITQARIAPDMATVLTKADADLSIGIQANGKGNFTINSSGRVIGDSADVQKVQALGSFVNDERKAIIKSSVSAIAKKTIAAVVQVSKNPAYSDVVPRPITRIDKSFVDIYRTVNAQAEMLNTNVKQINQIEASGDANEKVKNHLIETAKRIRETLGKYLLYRAGLPEGEEALKLNEYLLGGCIMSWVFHRLCSQKMQLGGKDFEFRKVYFPKDITKGIQVTLRELLTPALRDSQGGILVGMSVYRGLWTNDAIMVLTGISSDWDLKNFTGKAKVMSNIPFPVVPFPQAVTLEEHFTILSQNGERGLPWNVGSTISPQDVMKFVGTIPKRIAYGFLGRGRFCGPWYETLFKGFVFDPTSNERENRSVFNQLLNQFRSGAISTSFFSDIRGENGYNQCRSVLPALVVAVMDVVPDSSLAQNILAWIDKGMVAIPNGETQACTDYWAAFIAHRTMSDDACNEILAGILATNLDPRSKDVRKPDIRTARSGLSVPGALLLKEFKRRNYHALASRVDQWLRSFLTTDLQGPVAEVIMARLEASLATPIQFERSDAAVYMESAEFDPDDVSEDHISSHPDVDEGVNPDDQ
jgi:hypothetical protein